MKNYLQRLLLAFSVILFSFSASEAQTQPRIKLTQLEKARIASQIYALRGNVGMTDTAGNQRYVTYVANRDTCTSTSLPNHGTTTNKYLFSRFVYKCTTEDSVWYVDYRGKILLISGTGGGGSGCDNDWLEIGNNLCPNNINDSIYKYKYAAIGARYVWPRAELLVNDSTAAAYTVIQGFRNAGLSLFDRENQYWSIRQQAGSSLIDYLGGNSTQWLWTEAGGNATGAGAPFDNHFAIKASLDQIQAHKYPNTRDDAGDPVNIINTDASGNLRSDPLSTLIPAATSYRIESETRTTNFASGDIILSLSQTPKSAQSVIVDYNGQRLLYGVEYTVSGSLVTITFADPYVTSYDADPVFQISYPY